jgi:hypothetical protein
VARVCCCAILKGTTLLLVPDPALLLPSVPRAAADTGADVGGAGCSAVHAGGGECTGDVPGGRESSSLMSSLAALRTHKEVAIRSICVSCKRMHLLPRAGGGYGQGRPEPKKHVKLQHGTSYTEISKFWAGSVRTRHAQGMMAIQSQYVLHGISRAKTRDMRVYIACIWSWPIRKMRANFPFVCAPPVFTAALLQHLGIRQNSTHYSSVVTFRLQMTVACYSHGLLKKTSFRSIYMVKHLYFL